MKVSIITPTYNSEEYIKTTIDSVISQSYTDWEYIIIDDYSSDNTINIVNDYLKKDSRIRLIKLEVNSGAAIARNKGIENASGKYIAFLDSDDSWHKDKLEVQINEMETRDLIITYTNYFIKKEGQNKLKKFEAFLDTVKYEDITRFNYMACSTVVYNQAVLAKHYMPNIRKRQDWGLWITLLSDQYQAERINDYLMYYNVRSNSISSNKLSLIKYHWYIYRIFLSFNIIKSCRFLIINLSMHILNSRR